MAIDTKSLTEAQANWTQVTPTRTEAYAANAIARVGKWLAKTIAAIPNQQMAAVGAGVASRIQRNVSGRGQQRFPAKINTVGKQRFGPGVQAAGSDYSAGFGPYLQIIQGVSLPAKGPRGDPRNYALVQAVGDPLHRARLAATATGG